MPILPIDSSVPLPNASEHFNVGRVRALLPGESPRPSIGDLFGRLTVVAEAPKKGKYKCWEVRCTCGTVKVVYDSSLRLGKTASCGCLQKEEVTARQLTHGQTKGRQTKEYVAWRDMLQRCTNPNNPSYHNYGGRGIVVCPEWADFAVFFADMGKAPKGFTLERKRNSEGYSKDNCEWATYKTQLNNTRRTHYLTLEGVRLSVSQWAVRLGIPRETLFARIRRAEPVERILSTSRLD